jgi:hypothetical protein
LVPVETKCHGSAMLPVSQMSQRMQQPGVVIFFSIGEPVCGLLVNVIDPDGSRPHVAKNCGDFYRERPCWEE